LANLLQDSVDEGKGAMGETASPGVGFGPDGEELSGEVAAAGGFQVEVAVAEWVGKSPGVVNEALRGVGVRVDNEGGGVNLVGVGVQGRDDRHVDIRSQPLVYLVGSKQDDG
jgi:hypothetical protein